MYAQAHQVYRATAVQTADPGQLINMLYDRLARALRTAREELSAGRKQGLFQTEVSRAVDILAELNESLNREAGPVAEQLTAIYEFCAFHLIRAQIEADAGKIEQVAAVLEPIRQAWRDISRGPARTAAPAPEPATSASGDA